MTNYTNTPDEALLFMAENSENTLVDWQWNLFHARESVQRAEGMVASWSLQRDEQYQALQDRDIPPLEVLRSRPSV